MQPTIAVTACEGTRGCLLTCGCHLPPVDGSLHACQRNGIPPLERRQEVPHCGQKLLSVLLIPLLEEKNMGTGYSGVQLTTCGVCATVPPALCHKLCKGLHEPNGLPRKTRPCCRANFCCRTTARAFLSLAACCAEVFLSSLWTTPCFQNGGGPLTFQVCEGSHFNELPCSKTRQQQGPIPYSHYRRMYQKVRPNGKARGEPLWLRGAETWCDRVRCRRCGQSMLLNESDDFPRRSVTRMEPTAPRPLPHSKRRPQSNEKWASRSTILTAHSHRPAPEPGCLSRTDDESLSLGLPKSIAPPFEEYPANSASIPQTLMSTKIPPRRRRGSHQSTLNLHLLLGGVLPLARGQEVGQEPPTLLYVWFDAEPAHVVVRWFLCKEDCRSVRPLKSCLQCSYCLPTRPVPSRPVSRLRTLCPYSDLSLQYDVGDYGNDKSQSGSGSKETATCISCRVSASL